MNADHIPRLINRRSITGLLTLAPAVGGGGVEQSGFECVWLAAQHHQLEPLLHAVLEHPLQPLQPLGIALGEGIVEHQRQAVVVGRQQHLRHGQPQGRRQLFPHATAELGKAVGLPPLAQLQILKPLLGIEAQQRHPRIAGQGLQVGADCLP